MCFFFAKRTISPPPLSEASLAVPCPSFAARTSVHIFRQQERLLRAPRPLLQKEVVAGSSINAAQSGHSWWHCWGHFRSAQHQ